MSDNYFYKLLVEVLKIETNVLLNDVLRPAADAADIAYSGVDAAAAAYAEHTAASSSAGPASTPAGPDGAAAELAGVHLGGDEVGPSCGTAGVGDTLEGGDGDVAGLRGGQPHGGAPVFESPPHQEWVPGTQAQGWEAARKAAAAASGAGVQQVSHSCGHADIIWGRARNHVMFSC